MTQAPSFHLDAAAINEALLISGLHQHELTAEAVKLNTLLEKEINERKLAEAALQKANIQLADQAGELERLVAERTAKLRETVADLEAFSYSVAHDMRAPLGGMQGFARILLDSHAHQLDATAQDYLERIASSAARMDLLIQDVLNGSDNVAILGETAATAIHLLEKDPSVACLLASQVVALVIAADTAALVRWLSRFSITRAVVSVSGELSSAHWASPRASLKKPAGHCCLSRNAVTSAALALPAVVRLRAAKDWPMVFALSPKVLTSARRPPAPTTDSSRVTRLTPPKDVGVPPVACA